MKKYVLSISEYFPKTHAKSILLYLKTQSFIATHLMRVLQDIKTSSIILLFGNGVEKKQKKGILFLFQNIMLRMTLNVFGNTN